MKRKPDDLEMRVADRKRQLITEILEHKKSSLRFGAAEEIRRINRHLSELSDILKAEEWTKLSSATRLRLAEWIAR
jgi:hypothetical protein